jgi:hypothetical protein
LGSFFGFSPSFNINPSDTVTGLYADANLALHGFLRAADGTITTFDVPGAGTSFFQGTQPLGINPERTTACLL